MFIVHRFDVRWWYMTSINFSECTFCLLGKNVVRFESKLLCIYIQMTITIHTATLHKISFSLSPFSWFAKLFYSSAYICSARCFLSFRSMFIVLFFVFGDVCARALVCRHRQCSKITMLNNKNSFGQVIRTLQLNTGTNASKLEIYFYKRKDRKRREKRFSITCSFLRIQCSFTRLSLL